MNEQVVQVLLQDVCGTTSEGAAEVFLTTAHDQIIEFMEQRRLAEEDADEPDDDEKSQSSSIDGGGAALLPLKFIEHASHLVWVTLCYMVHFNDLHVLLEGDDYSEENARLLCKGIMSQICVPGQARYDDFLSIVKEEHFAESNVRDALLCVLREFENDFAEYDPIINPELDIASIRAKMETLFASRIADPDMADQVERGCHVYALMFSTVDSKSDALSDTRWRECYLTKCKQMMEWFKLEEPNTYNLCEDSSNAFLLPFVARQTLFSSHRQSIARDLHDHLLADKRAFDMENDHSGIESDFQCPVCGSYKTKTFLLQVRSADEPMTQFWKCWNCQKSGREN